MKKLNNTELSELEGLKNGKVKPMTKEFAERQMRGTEPQIRTEKVRRSILKMKLAKNPSNTFLRSIRIEVNKKIKQLLKNKRYYKSIIDNTP